jgi:3',5'-cyclic AMP phosphodiesterase CpdA
MIKNVWILLLAVAAAGQDFVQRPYLQLGNERGGLSLLWHAPDADADWQVESRSGSPGWTKAQIAPPRKIDVRGFRPHRVYEAALTQLPRGARFDYRVRLGEREVFASSGMAPRGPGEAHTFAVVGDTGNGSSGQRRLAVQMALAKPEYLVHVGDIVYMSGLISQYNRNHFPIYNCEPGTTAPCASLLRSTTTMAIPGNHDIHDTVRLGSQPGSLAYFYYWSQPLNGPLTDRGSVNLPRFTGSESAIEAFYDRAKNYPQMAMYSFDWGDAHWLMLDSNSYVDWGDPRLVDWVKKDLAAARGARWRFVALHHAPFSSARKHFSDQWMRQLAPMFEEGRVDVVFSGHVHSYQRTYPLRFRPNGEGRLKKLDGEFTFDKEFDGAAKTKPNGVVYLVTGAGGAPLKDGSKDNNPSKWQPFTAKFFASGHSFTLVDSTAERITIRQVDERAREVDRISITR